MYTFLFSMKIGCSMSQVSEHTQCERQSRKILTHAWNQRHNTRRISDTTTTTQQNNNTKNDNNNITQHNNIIIIVYIGYLVRKKCAYRAPPSARYAHSGKKNKSKNIYIYYAYYMQNVNAFFTNLGKLREIFNV